MNTYFKEKKDKREFIINRKFNLLNSGTLDSFNYESKSKSGACNDSSRITMNIKNEVIKQVNHDSNACVITTACIDLLCEKISNKKISEANDVLKNFKSFIERKDFNKDALEELIVFEDIVENKTRDYCLKLPLELIFDTISKIKL